jgi:ABC-type tungstate transport system permease subunit
MAVAKSTAAARRINRYDVMLLNPAKHPVPKQASARRFAQWLTSAERQAAIGGFQMGGEHLFHPSAAAPTVNRALRLSERRLSIVTMRIG